MQNEIYETLKAEILADEAQANLFSETLLKSKIDSAYREVKAARKYPSSYSNEQIETDMEKFHSNVEDIARYDYNAVGSEGMSSYSADGTSIHYRDRDKLFYGVYPIAR
jgi:hypothetical protein